MAIEGRLPVEFLDGFTMNAEKAKIFGQTLNNSYVSAAPFPHIVIDNFLPDEIAEASLADFPASLVKDESSFEIGYYGHHKRQIPPTSCNSYSRNLFAFFNSAPMLKFLEGLTGINKLLPDPYYFGGGYHETSRGGLLGIHADFQLNQLLNMRRRVNIIIYLNKDWQEEWGGGLELWDKSMKFNVHTILPIFNRCAIFNTNHDAFHGHPNPLNCPDTATRKSIALYYYTASDSILNEVPRHANVYMTRPGDTKDLKIKVLKETVDTYLYDWLPPILARRINPTRKVWKRFRRALRLSK